MTAQLAVTTARAAAASFPPADAIRQMSTPVTALTTPAACPAPAA
jgi:hypothetical protein